jgi:hypothetical protein
MDIYTWNNRQQDDHFTKARLDRFLATFDWITAFPNPSNSHLLRFKSVHSPILLDFSPYAGNLQGQPKARPMRYEQAWTRDDMHYQLVKESWASINETTQQKLKTTLSSLHRWGNKRFGIIPRRIRHIQEELHILNEKNGSQNLTDQLRIKEKELDNLLESEELWWEQRARALWLQHGDKNTKFFHMKANIRRQKNKIEAITDDQGTSHYEKDDIERVFVQHFQNHFTSQTTLNIV